MRVVAGRLETSYQYSANIVYNNFPWPSLGTQASPPAEENDEGKTAGGTPSSQAIARIEQTARAILDARALYPDCSLADLYDDNTMPPELRRAHQDNDRAVMEAYGYDWRSMTESDCVAELFKRYQAMKE